MEAYTSGCLHCGKPLIYYDKEREITCLYCNNRFVSNATCEDGHYICDSCHSKKAFDYFAEYVLATDKTNPIQMATELMRNPFMNMHGPEHHFLVAAVLLASYKNAGGELNLPECVEMARQRAINVPGGICGLWGSCGAAVGCGIFYSVATGATPMSKGTWGNANLMTSKCLYNIGMQNGPRCCKRNTFISLSSAVEFIKECMGIELEMPEIIKCSFFYKNNECKKEECMYYPVK